MARHIKLTGKAKSYFAVGMLIFAAVAVFGQSFFSFNIGYFNQGFQTSFLRGGHFQKQGSYWQQHDRTLGHIVTPGNETLSVDLSADISRGTLVLYAWRWPAFLFEEPMIYRFRVSEDTDERLDISLPGAGLYVFSASGINLRGNISVDWRARE